MSGDERRRHNCGSGPQWWFTVAHLLSEFGTEDVKNTGCAQVSAIMASSKKVSFMPPTRPLGEVACW